MVFQEITFIITAISPIDPTLARFQPIFKSSGVFAAVGQNLRAKAMLLVILPFSLILTAPKGLRFLSKVAGLGGCLVVPGWKPVVIFAVAMAAVIEPFAFIGLAAIINEASMPSGLALHPVALIDRPISPDLHTSAMLLLPFPFADVHFVHVADLRGPSLDFVALQADRGLVFVLAVVVAGVGKQYAVRLDCDSLLLYSLIPWPPGIAMPAAATFSPVGIRARRAVVICAGNSFPLIIMLLEKWYRNGDRLKYRSVWPFEALHGPYDSYLPIGVVKQLHRCHLALIVFALQP
jgi:hypothetical protein